MAAPVAALIAKAAIAAATDKRTWKGFAVVLAAVFMPFILAVLVMMSFLSGGASHNADAVKLAFQGGSLPSGTPTEYQQHVTGMRDAFGKLDQAISRLNIAPTDGSLDSIRVKAVFYSLYVGADSLRGVDYNAFASCFVKTETRTRTVTNPDGTQTQETYAAHVPLDSMPQIYANLEKTLGRTISSDEKANATQIYYEAKYGTSAPTETDSADMWGDWTPSAYSGASGSTVPAGNTGVRAVQLAKSRLGDPYSEELRGTENYTDCSYLALWTYRQLGVQLPGTAAEQGQYCVEHGLTVPKDQLAPGDLVFWSFEPNGRYMNITHVAIYAGDGMVVSASSTQGKVIYCKIFDAGAQVLYGRPYGK
ncbi:MAG: NlpC/P60 family protein [Ethanoligenens sp.]